MRLRKSLGIIAGTLLILTLVVGLTPALAGKAVKSEVPMVEDVFTWQLSNARVVAEPLVSDTKKGILVTGYTLEAEAKALEDFAPVTQGKFRLTLTVFSPKADTPQQKAGLWYLRGSWTITDDNRDPKAAKARYGAGIVKGDLNAELPFNPLSQSGIVNARVRLPMLPQGGRWGSGQGVFSGNELFAGQLTVTLNRRLATN